MPHFEISESPIDVARLRELLLGTGAGAYASFEGWVRDRNDGRAVQALTYESYRTLAEAEGAAILAEAHALRHPAGRLRAPGGPACVGRTCGVGRRQRRASRAGLRRLSLDHRRSEIARSDLEARALCGRWAAVAASIAAGRWPLGLDLGGSPCRLASAPESVNTVAAFRPWRSFQPIVARGRQRPP